MFSQKKVFQKHLKKVQKHIITKKNNIFQKKKIKNKK